jgi:hypothetical protein
LIQQLYYSYPAPPLTFDNVFEVVKRVGMWRELARRLMGWSDLDAIEYRHISREARLKAVVEAFLLGEGRYQPSWRNVIRALHWARVSNVAEKIKTNAEPHQGEYMG